MTAPPPPFDLAVAARPSMGQDPVRALPDAAGRLDAVWVTWPYGRIGNNLYQLLNAAVVARFGGFRRLILPPMPGLVSAPAAAVDGLAVSVDAAPEPSGCLAGSFFVPFGCEAAALRCSAAALAGFARRLADGLCAELLAGVAGPATTALHFRSGDVFRAGPDVPAAYAQPPAAFYLKALAHARSRGADGPIDLVYEDRANPAIAAVEAALEAAGLPYRSAATDAGGDLRRLLAADTLVASASTFVEAAALLSRRLARHYSFRDHCSQSEFKPFAQSRVGAVLAERGVGCVLIDDVTRGYVNKWQWGATPEQRAAIVGFDVADLRLYESA